MVPQGPEPQAQPDTLHRVLHLFLHGVVLREACRAALHVQHLGGCAWYHFPIYCMSGSDGCSHSKYLLNHHGHARGCCGVHSNSCTRSGTQEAGKACDESLQC